MRFSDLGYDVLHQVFSLVCSSDWEDFGEGERYAYMIELSSLCRSWRRIILPHLYKKIFVYYHDSKVKSNVRLALSGGFVDYARVFEVRIAGTVVDNVDLVAELDEIGIGDAVWPKINRLGITNKYGSHAYDDYNEERDEFKSTSASVKAAMDYLGKHMPSLKEVGYYHNELEEGEYYEGIVERNRGYNHPYFLLSEIINGLSAQINKLDLRVAADKLTRVISFPQQLTHLDIAMDGYEKEMLPKIFALSLQSLSIIEASPDSSWNWFDSGDGDHVSFKGLKQLAIGFYRSLARRPTYHSGKVSSADLPRRYSDYKDTVKHVHFPVLERLAIKNYTFLDGSFYRLFEDSPLKAIDIESPLSIGHSIPPQMLTNLSLMKVKLWFEDSQFRANKNISRKAEYEKALAALTSVPTTASRASLTLDGRFVFSLASSLVWSTVQRFELHGNIDVPSLFVILAQMPRLQHLALGFTAPYLNAFYKKSSAESKQAGKQVHVANRSLSYLSVKLGMRTKLAKGTLQPFLSDLLPLVPVLSILRAYPNLVDVVKKIVADPNDSLQEAAQHLEVVGE